ncbi:sensor histidine kinase [Agromyces salentinus]|uniref:histidine kinase n=1 Tax=Agromyces salentinus TaxID=269421 RepID=A0ABP4Z4D6_9MICO|nr:ATP-binding protein [Agromyces salentinus]
MTQPGWLARLSSDSLSPGFKQVPTAIGLVLAVVTTLVVPGVAITVQWAAWSGVAILVTVTAFAFTFPWRRFDHEWAIVIPVLSILAIGLFRLGTGGFASIFGSLIILPFVWIASEEGRSHIVLSAAAVCVALQLPFLTGHQVLGDGQLMRGFFAPLVYLVAAGIINELSHLGRVQLANAEALLAEREGLLADAEARRAELESSQAQLRASEAFNLSIWQAVKAEAVIVTDRTGLILTAGPGADRMLGVPFEDGVEQRYLTQFLAGDELRERARNFMPGVDPITDRESFMHLVEAARAAYGDNSEWTFVDAAGERIPVQLSASPRLDESGDHVGYIFIGTDVTGLHEVNRLKDEFVGMISHELRTPLTSVLGYLELIRDDEQHPLTAEQFSYLAIAERNAHRLLALVGDLLLTAQVESGTFPLDIREVDLVHVVLASVESARPAATRGGIELRADNALDSMEIPGDATRLAQACDNLISNALKFTKPDGTVSVSLEMVDGYARIAVTDTGMGIPAGEVERLFTRFFRSSTAIRQAVQGVGLGLSITKAIVSAHHGTMTVSSVEGRGTTFAMLLPMHAGARTTSAMPNPPGGSA